MSSQPVTPLSLLPETSTDSLLQEEFDDDHQPIEDVNCSCNSWETVPSPPEPAVPTPHTSPALPPAPTTPPADDCVICTEPITNPATVKPCGHVFDLGCICSWVIQKGSGRTKCPLCNGLMTEIQHYATDSSTAEPQLRTISTGEAPDQESGPADRGPLDDILGPRADEVIEEGMSDRTIHAARERRRLRALPRRGENVRMRPPDSDFWVKFGDLFVFVEEHYDVLIVQDGLMTTSNLDTMLSLQFKRESEFDVLPECRTDRQAIEAHTKIANIINEHVRDFMPARYIERVMIGAYKVEIVDERGIRSRLQRSTFLTREANEETTTALRLKREIDFTEEGPANKDDDLRHLTAEELAVDRMRREDYVRVARTDIQRMMRRINLLPGSNRDFGLLDRATTNLLEPSRQSSEREDNIWWRGVNEILNLRPFRRS